MGLKLNIEIGSESAKEVIAGIKGAIGASWNDAEIEINVRDPDLDKEEEAMKKVEGVFREDLRILESGLKDSLEAISKRVEVLESRSEEHVK